MDGLSARRPGSTFESADHRLGFGAAGEFVEGRDADVCIGFEGFGGGGPFFDCYEERIGGGRWGCRGGRV